MFRAIGNFQAQQRLLTTVGPYRVQTEQRLDVSDVDQLIKGRVQASLPIRPAQLARNSVSSNINNRAEAWLLPQDWQLPIGH